MDDWERAANTEKLGLVIYEKGYSKMSDYVAKQLSTERISDCWERVTGKLGEGSYDNHPKTYEK